MHIFVSSYPSTYIHSGILLRITCVTSRHPQSTSQPISSTPSTSLRRHSFVYRVRHQCIQFLHLWRPHLSTALYLSISPYLPISSTPSTSVFRHCIVYRVRHQCLQFFHLRGPYQHAHARRTRASSRVRVDFQLCSGVFDDLDGLIQVRHTRSNIPCNTLFNTSSNTSSNMFSNTPSTLIHLIQPLRYF